MTRSHTCRHCLALGLLASVLIHATTWYLVWRITPPPPPLPPMAVLDLDLAVFADAPDGTGAAGADEPVLTGPVPSDAAPTPEQSAAMPPPPAPLSAPADPTPAVADALATPPVLQPAPVPSIQPAPVRAITPPPAEPKRRQEPKRTTPKPVQATPKAKPKPKPEPKSVAKPVPEPRPKPPEPTRTQTSPRQATAAAGSGVGTRPQAAAGGAAGAGARPATGATSAAAERAYLAELQRAISRHQRFPEAARQRRKTGVATVAFVVTADGRITQARIAKSSGDPDLDQAAVAALNRLGRFKPIPAATGRASWPMRVPIRFDLR